MDRPASPYALVPSAGARRYFSQFLGEPTRWSPGELAFLCVIEDQDPEALAQTGQQAYLGVRSLQGRQEEKGRLSSEDTVALFPGQTPLTLPDLRTAFYAALVNAVVREMGMEAPVEVRGSAVAGETPGIPSDHLTLIGRFSMEVMQGLRQESSFSGVMAVTLERLGDILELAAQSMMGADVDPYETYEHEPCSACGHILQRHVGFESWEEVLDEHRQWCPGSHDPR